MMEYESESELERLDFVADVLQPIKLVVWGDLAISYLGVRAVHSCYMLGVRDDEMELAAKKLADAGFVRQNWSFGSTIDPATRKDNEMFQRVHANIGLAFANFDAKTIRFHYPDEKKFVQRTILIPSSYLRLSASQPASKHESASPLDPFAQPPFYVHGNLYFPNAVELLRSIIAVYLEEREYTNIRNWQVKLAAWAFGYLYGELLLRDDVLDTCEDEMVKECFNKGIKRGSNISRVREKWGKPRALITNDCWFAKGMSMLITGTCCFYD